MTQPPLPPSAQPGPLSLREFILAFDRLLAPAPPEAEVLREGAGLLARLVARDDWLPVSHAQAHPQHYQQHLLHVDSGERFSIVSFVWGPGQATPVHDHTVWGLIGMLRGNETAQPYTLAADGRPEPAGPATRLVPGQVEAVSPTIGDLHLVRNAHDDQVSVSIHVYGANIGAVHRHVYLPDGTAKPFVSGYSAAPIPNVWGQA